MSDFFIDIVDIPIYYLNIDTTINEDIDNIEIIKYNDHNLEIINAEKVTFGDIIGEIPMSNIIGNLPITRLDFGNPYGVGYTGLNSYLNQYEFDCGSP